MYVTGLDPDPPPPPHATNATIKMPDKSSHGRRRWKVRGLQPRNRNPAIEIRAAYSGEACQLPLRFCKDADVEGTLTASVNGTAELPGVMVVGLKVQVAPAGKELCRQESVMGCFELPELAFRDIEKFAVPPGETVCGAGVDAEGAATIVIASVPMAVVSACETASMMTVDCAGTLAGAV